MISKISIQDIATYSEYTEFYPNKINYVYGGNGTGKTALSKLLSNPDEFEHCEVLWQHEKLQTVVYNKDFVSKNFGQDEGLKGIFTLGKDTKEAKEYIENAKKELGVIENHLKSLRETLISKKKMKEDADLKFSDDCWKFKVKYEELFKPAFYGFIGSKKAFKEKCLKEKDNSSKLLEYDVLKQKCQSMFDENITEYENIPDFEFADLELLESKGILSENILGKDDVPISKLIKYLNNSDWIKNGLDYIEKSDGKCPFCQQILPSDMEKSFNEFFDDNFENKCKQLQKFKQEYDNYMSSKILQLKQNIKKNIIILDFSVYERIIENIETMVLGNLNIIDSKIKAPSTIVTLQSLQNLFQQSQDLIKDFQKKISSNNILFKNLKSEKKKLNAEIWKFVCSELKHIMDNYLVTEKTLIKAIEAVTNNGISDKEKKNKLLQEINTKEAEVTGITHTVNEINKILVLFGYTNFKIAEISDKGYYKIIRENGEDGKETLSEGEYTFITFLYFFQLLKGSIEKSGISGDKVIVIDDPISSLDSGILFIVSNLIKELISDCKNNSNGVKQVFVLTHNIYFHKEVTFKGSREHNSNDESFWSLRKLNNITKISRHKKNPIQTTYELLWSEIAEPTKINKVTVFNTSRRILEYYFDTIGDMDYEKCLNSFDGDEKLVCKTLLSWINDGSHFISDDLQIDIDYESVDRYLTVFKKIFEKMGHINHYNMMMGRSYAILLEEN